MIHLPFGNKARQRQLLREILPTPAQVRTLSRDEAQEVVDAATAILDGLKVLLALARQGNPDAADALRQWARVLEDVRRFGG